MKYALSICLTLSILFSGCSDGSYEVVCIGGKGGDLTFIFKPQHHGVAITSTASYRDTIYVKYGTQEYPGGKPDDYDEYYVGEPGDDFIKVTNMRCGVHYIYGKGFDTSIAEVVRGGIPFITEQQSGTIEIVVPVTED
jgi:hypothetical protein